MGGGKTAPQYERGANMKVINVRDENAIELLTDWARVAYVRACRQSDANQWTAEAAGYPDGRIELYDIIYGNSTSEDIYNGRAHSILTIRGEDYSSVETEASYDDDPQAYQDEIDELMAAESLDKYEYSDVVSDAINAYREWMREKTEEGQ